ncbi:hypothetical protein OAM92_02595, partial [Acidimicrobiales bacterium]|nr:hypothetical protein [Acidimicrobiales bacterium]
GVIAGGVSFTGCLVGLSAGWNDINSGYPDGNIVSGDNNDGVWRLTLTVPAGLASCTLSLFGVDICDGVDQCVSLRPSEGDLDPLTIEVVNNTAPDTTPPVVTSVVASTAMVDITEGDATFTVDVAGVDEGVGVIAGGVSFTGCLVGLSAGWNDINSGYPDGNIVSGDNNDGVWRLTLTVPAGLASCTLSLFGVDICDGVDQCVSLRPSEGDLDPLTIEVVNNAG